MSIYTAAPIVEAVLQIVLEKPVSSADFRKIVKRVGRHYQNHLSLQLVEAKFDVEKRDASVTDSGVQERFTSPDEADIAAFQQHIFSWSRLAPYQSWEPFFERFSRDFEIINKVVGYEKVQRLGLRFINRIDIPLDKDLGHFEKYLTIKIDLPREWELIENYGWRFQRLFEEYNSMAIVQSVIGASVMPDCGAVFLDIDVSSVGEVDSKVDQIYAKLAQLRKLKNHIFENSITDMARARFKSQ